MCNGDQVTLLGPDRPGGCYLLRIQASVDKKLVFGRFKKGKSIPVPARQYIYVGSAMGRRGAATLARRLVRHATRSDHKPPHHIRPRLLEAFSAAHSDSAELLPKTQKKLFWNIDYLLDDIQVELLGVIALRTSLSLEARIANLILDAPHTGIFERGLGAGDSPGSTHLLSFDGDQAWWESLPDALWHSTGIA